MLNRLTANAAAHVVSDNEEEESRSGEWQFSTEELDAQDSYLLYDHSSSNEIEQDSQEGTGILIVDNDSRGSDSQLSYPDSLPTEIESLNVLDASVCSNIERSTNRKLVWILLAFVGILATITASLVYDRRSMTLRVSELEQQLDKASDAHHACISQVATSNKSNQEAYETDFDWANDEDNTILADNCWFKLALGDCGNNAKECFDEGTKKFQEWFYNDEDSGILQAAVSVEGISDATKSMAGAAVKFMDSMVFFGKQLDDFTTESVAYARDAVKDASIQL